MTDRLLINDLCISLATREVMRDGEAITLPALSFDVLACLVRRAPEAVSGEVLAREAWNMAHVSEETIAQRIALLRKALGDDPRTPRYIRTVRGQGYALAAEARPAGFDWRKRRPGVLQAAAAGIFAIAVWLAWPDAPSSETEPGNDRPADPAEAYVVRAQEQLMVAQPDTTDRAISLLREALDEAPGSIRARTALSFALSTRATKFEAQDNDRSEAEALARGVIAADPENPDAWHALGYALDSQARVAEALAAYQRAYAINPEDNAAMSSAAYLLAISGRLHEALALETAGLQTGRRSRYAETQIAFVLDLLGLDAAAAWRDRSLALNPGQIVVLGSAAEMALRSGDPAAAAAYLDQLDADAAAAPNAQVLQGRVALARNAPDQARQAFDNAGPAGLAHRAALAAAAGDTATARAAIADEQSKRLAGDSWPENSILIAEIHAALGDDAAALAEIGRAIELGWRDAARIESAHYFERLRTQPDYQVLLDRIERELAAQRELVLTDPALSAILEPDARPSDQ